MINSLVTSAVEQLQSVSQTHLGDSRVKNATVQKLGPDGKSPAQRVYIDFSQVKVDGKGQTVGRSIGARALFKGATLSSSSLRLSPEGHAVSVLTTLYDRFAGGTHRVVESDLSGLNWLYGRVTDGALKVRSSRHDGTLVSEGSIVFAAEQLDRADISSFAADGSGTLCLHTSLDFSQAEFLAGEIVGGTLIMQSRRPDGRARSESSTSFAPNGLPTGFVLKVFDEAGVGVRSVSEYDYSGVTFNALKEIDGGVLVITTRRPTGEIISKERITYRGSVPAGYQSETPDRRGAVGRRVSIDYTGVRFNQSRRPHNSTVEIHVTDAGGSPVSTTSTEYGPNGLPLWKRTRSRAGGGDQVQSETDYRQAEFDSNYRVVGGHTITTVVLGRRRAEVVRSFEGRRQYTTKEKRVYDIETAVPLRYEKSYRRPDGTMLKFVKLRMGSDGRPQKGSVTYFATDGRTVTSNRRIDYSGVAYASGALSGGTALVSTRDGRGRARSRGQVTFG